MHGHNLQIKTCQHKKGGTVATVTVSNDARLNCLSRATTKALADAFDTLADLDDLRAIVLTGAGERAFIGGADLKELGAADADGARLFITSLHQACDAIRRCPVPVIARINGFCLGAGLEVAISCDMRASCETAIFGMPEVHMGLPSVIEAALMPGLIGWGKTRELLLTGRTFGADEALAMGLVERVVPQGALSEAVDTWLDDLVAGAPEAVRAQKLLIRRWEDATVTEGIKHGIDALSDAYLTGEPQQRIADFFARRAAEKAKG